MRGDHKPVSLEAFGMRDMSYWRREMATVWVVQLDEGREPVFRVGITAANGEDVVGCGSAVWRDRDRPREVCLVVMRAQGRFWYVLGVLGVGPCLSLRVVGM
jgi:hypothetical protein